MNFPYIVICPIFHINKIVDPISFMCFVKRKHTCGLGYFITVDILKFTERGRRFLCMSNYFSGLFLRVVGTDVVFFLFPLCLGT